jgi:uncharacterized protein with von Willebrand factor type A (vWA) domain
MTLESSPGDSFVKLWDEEKIREPTDADQMALVRTDGNKVNRLRVTSKRVLQSEFYCVDAERGHLVMSSPRDTEFLLYVGRQAAAMNAYSHRLMRHDDSTYST